MENNFKDIEMQNCKNKKRYLDKSSVKYHASWFLSEFNYGFVSFYKCKICHCWHITRQFQGRENTVFRGKK